MPTAFIMMRFTTSRAKGMYDSEYLGSREPRLHEGGCVTAGAPGEGEVLAEGADDGANNTLELERADERHDHEEDVDESGDKPCLVRHLLELALEAAEEGGGEEGDHVANCVQDGEGHAVENQEPGDDVEQEADNQAGSEADEALRSPGFSSGPCM